MSEEKISIPVASWVSKLREDEDNPLMSDAVLIVEDAEGVPPIKAHRNVLAASCRFFERSFNSGMLESQTGEVRFARKEMCPESLLAIVRMIYGRTVGLSGANVTAIHAASDFLEVGVVSRKCLQYMKGHVNDLLIFKFWDYARPRDFEGSAALLNLCKNYIAENFMALYVRSELLELKRAELVAFLSINNLKMSSENCVLDAILTWLNHNWLKRFDHANALLGLINWANVDYAKLHALQSVSAVRDRVPGNQAERDADYVINKKLSGPPKALMIKFPVPRDYRDGFFGVSRLPGLMCCIRKRSVGDNGMRVFQNGAWGEHIVIDYDLEPHQGQESIISTGVYKGQVFFFTYKQDQADLATVDRIHVIRLQLHPNTAFTRVASLKLPERRSVPAFGISHPVSVIFANGWACVFGETWNADHEVPERAFIYDLRDFAASARYESEEPPRRTPKLDPYYTITGIGQESGLVNVREPMFTIVGDCLVILGGSVVGSDDDGNGAEAGSPHVKLFSLVDHLWSDGPALPYRFDSGSAALLTQGNHLFVAGGKLQGLSLSTVCSFELGQSQWTLLPPFLRPRIRHSLGACGSSLYTFAGRSGQRSISRAERLDLGHPQSGWIDVPGWRVIDFTFMISG